MQTSLPDEYRATPVGQRADQILRSCVHCGFCNATCPTYQLLGDELDGPRGRIYLIKDMLEQQSVDRIAVTHLDRCLTCRACETTCPSGVAYGELLEIGRNYQETHRRRGWFEAIRRSWLLRVVPDRRAFRRWAALGRLAGPFLGRRLRSQLPRRSRQTQSVEAPASPIQKVLLLDGCVQQVSTPAANNALAALLSAGNIEVIRLADESCCGGLALHLGQDADALATMGSNLDAIARVLDQVDAVISTASGCGVTLKDYARHLAGDAGRATTALAFVDKVRDVGEFLVTLGWEWAAARDERRVAVHIPCTLQHGQRLGAEPGQILEAAGYELVKTADPHLCCGSAGSYAILQPELSEQLGAAKVAALGIDEPELIATANVGCQVHLGGLADLPVVHWIELLRLREPQEAGQPMSADTADTADAADAAG